MAPTASRIRAMSTIIYEFGAWRGLVTLREGRVRVHVWGEDHRALIDRAAGLVDAGLNESTPAKVGLQALLKDYFSGRTVEPARWPVDLEGLSSFDRAVYEAVRSIPGGKTATYGEIAARAGSPCAARAVGNALARNPIPLFIPCHRVRGANGPGGWSGPPGWKERLLVLEGAGVTMQMNKKHSGSD